MERSSHVNRYGKAFDDFDPNDDEPVTLSDLDEEDRQFNAAKAKTPFDQEEEPDEDDPVVAEYDVYVTPQLPNQLFVILEYPEIRNTDRPLTAAAGRLPTNLRIKPDTGFIEVEIPINLPSEQYDRRKGVQWGEALRKTKQFGQDGYGAAVGYDQKMPRPKKRKSDKNQDDEEGDGDYYEGEGEGDGEGEVGGEVEDGEGAYEEEDDEAAEAAEAAAAEAAEVEAEIQAEYEAEKVARKAARAEAKAARAAADPNAAPQDEDEDESDSDEVDDEDEDENEDDGGHAADMKVLYEDNTDKYVNNFEDAKEKGHVLETMTYYGQITKPRKGAPTYMAGVLRGDVLHLTHIDHIIQMRAGVSHLDAEHQIEIAKKKGAAYTDPQEYESIFETDPDKIQFHKDAAKEPWQKFNYHDVKSPESREMFEKQMIYRGPDIEANTEEDKDEWEDVEEVVPKPAKKVQRRLREPSRSLWHHNPPFRPKK